MVGHFLFQDMGAWGAKSFKKELTKNQLRYLTLVRIHSSFVGYLALWLQVKPTEVPYLLASGDEVRSRHVILT